MDAKEEDRAAETTRQASAREVLAREELTRQGFGAEHIEYSITNDGVAWREAGECADAQLAALDAAGFAVVPKRPDDRSEPCPLCGFRIREVPEQPFVFDDDGDQS